MPKQRSKPITREDFARWLEEAKWTLRTRDKSDGPNKALARAIGVAPSRVGEFMDPGSFIKVVTENETLISDVRLRKTVAGFQRILRESRDRSETVSPTCALHSR